MEKVTGWITFEGRMAGESALAHYTTLAGTGISQWATTSNGWSALTKRKDVHVLASQFPDDNSHHVFRLSVLLAPNQQVDVADSIKQDMTALMTAMADEYSLNLRDFGITNGLENVLRSLRDIYRPGA